MKRDDISEAARVAAAEPAGPAVAMVEESKNDGSTPAPKRLITIIAPVFNEEQNVLRFHAAVGEAMANLLDRYKYEILFTDNCSTDQTFQIIAELAHKDRRIRALRFSRNFGFQRSVLTNHMCAVQSPRRGFLRPASRTTVRPGIMARAISLRAICSRSRSTES